MLPSQLEMDVDTNGLTEVLTFDERTPKLTGRLDRTAEENRSAAASQPPPTTVRLIDQSAAAHGVAPGLGGPSEQWLWAAASAHHMLFSFAFHIFCQPRRDARMAAAEWRRYRLLAWNPLYWLAWLPTVVAIAVGRWFHAFFGQHNAIDEHETDLEFQAHAARNSVRAQAAQFSQRAGRSLQVRVWWLYFADGAMLLLGVVGLLSPLLTWAEEEMGMCGKPGASSCSVDGAALQMGFDEAVRHRNAAQSGAILRRGPTDALSSRLRWRCATSSATSHSCARCGGATRPSCARSSRAISRSPSCWRRCWSRRCTRRRAGRWRGTRRGSSRSRRRGSGGASSSAGSSSVRALMRAPSHATQPSHCASTLTTTPHTSGVVWYLHLWSHYGPGAADAPSRGPCALLRGLLLAFLAAFVVVALVLVAFRLAACRLARVGDGHGWVPANATNTTALCDGSGSLDEFWRAFA